MEYLGLNAIVLTAVLFVAIISRLILNKFNIIGLFGLIILTAIFDSLIITNEIVGYDAEKNANLYIIKAPIEDFAYTIAAFLLVPVIFEFLSRKNNGKN